MLHRNTRPLFVIFCLLVLVATAPATVAKAQESPEVRDASAELSVDTVKPAQLFEDGNYAMFIHWGIYSQLGNRFDGKTYYGIGEWMMHKTMAKIPIARYKKLASTFHPKTFDAKTIVKVAKEAGMKYIVITSKHHDGFAMYHSKVNKFNVVDATPWNKDPMKELAAACAEAGIGFGFYYSHNQDWTFPGGGGGPGKDADGNRATFDDYFKKKCLPQVEEITSEYGPIQLVWFDTPGKIPKKYVEQLVAVVRKNQPNALVSGRAGHGLGDYKTLGDMEVPPKRVNGMWESVDTTNDSWAYAWYDEYWKSPREILHRLIACVGRGGTYMLNVGPDGDGVIPQRAVDSLKKSGDWVKRYPQVIYGADPSPWDHKMPWGDVTAKGNRLFLTVFDWPASGNLYLPGLKTKVAAARLLKGKGDESQAVDVKQENGWTMISLPFRSPEKLAAVIELELDGSPQVDSVWGIDPEQPTKISTEFATVSGDAQKAEKRWMEKYGEWKRITEVRNFSADSKASWEVEVLQPGEYNIDLNYAGEGRLVWSVEVEGGQKIRNQQDSSHIYHSFPIGWINFAKPGRYVIHVSLVDGNAEKASLKSIRFSAVR